MDECEVVMMVQGLLLGNACQIHQAATYARSATMQGYTGGGRAARWTDFYTGHRRAPAPASHARPAV